MVLPVGCWWELNEYLACDKCPTGSAVMGAGRLANTMEGHRVEWFARAPTPPPGDRIRFAKSTAAGRRMYRRDAAAGTERGSARKAPGGLMTRCDLNAIAGCTGEGRRPTNTDGQ